MATSRPRPDSSLLPYQPKFADCWCLLKNKALGDDVAQEFKQLLLLLILGICQMPPDFKPDHFSFDRMFSPESGSDTGRFEMLQLVYETAALSEEKLELIVTPKIVKDFLRPVFLDKEIDEGEWGRILHPTPIRSISKLLDLDEDLVLRKRRSLQTIFTDFQGKFWQTKLLTPDLDLVEYPKKEGGMWLQDWCQTMEADSLAISAIETFKRHHFLPQANLALLLTAYLIRYHRFGSPLPVSSELSHPRELCSEGGPLLPEAVVSYADYSNLEDVISFIAPPGLPLLDSRKDELWKKYWSGLLEISNKVERPEQQLTNRRRLRGVWVIMVRRFRGMKLCFQTLTGFER